MGSQDDCGSVGRSIETTIPSDLRYHDQAPHTRVLGKPRWFKTGVKDKTGCLLDFKITLDATKLPFSADYKLDPTYHCQNKKILTLKSKTGSGSNKIVMAPIVKCTIGSDDSGTMFVRVSKVKGISTHSAAKLKLTIKP